jgi:DNA-binding CsgD family transcriptional regulator
VVLVRGAAGIGKTALLEYAVGSAEGFQVVRASGVESEMELAFAALHQLCSPFLSGLDRLPVPQRLGLETAFGLSLGDPPDPFFVGLGVLSLLSDAASAGRPVLCVVDDVQWLDRASALALGLVARRLEADAVALVLAARDSVEVKELSGLAELRLDSLSAADSRGLLSSVLPGRVDERVVERILAETEGNPLALIELPRGMSAAELAGGFGLLEKLGLSGRIEESFRRRLEPLPTETRRLLLVAAAEESGEADLLWRACDLLGVGPEAAVAAEDEDLIRIDPSVRFFHPLVRSAVYQAASKKERRQAHQALAEVIDPIRDPDRRAWHRAEATARPDELIAAELERSAGRAQARGGLAAAAAFLERASALSLDPESRTRRALAAAESKHLAGAHDAALELLAMAETGSLTELQRAQADLLRAEIAYLRGGDLAAPSLLLQAAERLEPLDPLAARDTYLDALIAAGFAGRLAGPKALREAAEVARRAYQAGPAPRPADLFLDGLATAFIDGYASGAPLLMSAIQGFRSGDVSLHEELRWLWPASHASMALWDDASYDALSARHIDLGRGMGLLAVLPIALTSRVVAHAFFGELEAAEMLIADQRALTEAMGIPTPPYGPLLVAAWRGKEQEAFAAIDVAIPDITARGEGGGLAFADYALAVLNTGLGRYQEALTAASSTDAFDSEGFSIYPQGLAEIIEPAVRVGAYEQARDALTRLSDMAEHAGTDWARGVRARAEALLTDDSSAETLYREAIDRLGRTRIRPQLARSHLLYGEWLRRENRRVDARQQLRIAHDMFDDMGIEAFAGRARHELAATGVSAHSRRDATLNQLTPQEERIAKMAGQGLSDAQIAGQLYISRATVDYHLRKVFRKLGVRSRKQLADKTTPAAAHG